MRYKKTVQERLEQITQAVERLVERVDDNSINADELSKMLETVAERLIQVTGLVELEDDDDDF
jgi:methyl-accepting chemotaxis protein